MLRRWGIALLTIAVAMLLGAQVPDSARPIRKRLVRPTSSRLDPVELKARIARNRSRIDDMRARLARERTAQPQGQLADRKDVWTSPDHLRAAMFDVFFTPCLYGGREVCEQLVDVIYDCGGGDNLSCVAAAQFVEDTPPRSTAGRLLWVVACKLGEREACARLEQLKIRPERCSDDVAACTFAAMRDKDEARFQEACDLDVAEGCSMAASNLFETEPERAFARMERSCSLGNVYACVNVGDMLSISCEETEDSWYPCFEPDPTRSAEAFAIACDAGDTKSCGR